MNSYTTYLNQISRIKRIILKRTFQRFFLWTLLFYGPFASITLILHQVRAIRGSTNQLFGMTLAASFLLALWFIVKSRPRLMDELIDIETRLGLKSMLSTAYEYSHINRKNAFTYRLISDASDLLQIIHPKELFPRIFTRLHILIPIFMLLFTMLFLWGLYPDVLQNKAVEDPILPPIASKIRDFIKRESPPIYNDQKQPRDEIYQTMGDMIRQLGEKRLDRNALTSAIQDMVQAVVTEQDGTRQRIRATLNPGDMTDSPLPKFLEYGTLSLDEVQKTTELLKELFQGEIPASIAEDLSTLERHSRVGRFLDEILNELRAGRDSKPDSPFPDQKDRAFTAQTAPEAQTGDPTRTSDHAFMEEQTSNSIRRNSSPLTPSGGRSSGEEGDAGDQDMEQDLFSGIGDAKARGTKKSPQELQDSKGLKIKEQGVSLVGEHYNAQVRSLTSIGKPEMDEGEILRHYEQEIEEVLQKEDMPLNYREYIKTYFLSIGVGRKNHTNEGTH